MPLAPALLAEVCGRVGLLMPFTDGMQQLLGHSTVVMTQRYPRISDEMVRREVERAVTR